MEEQTPTTEKTEETKATQPAEEGAAQPKPKRERKPKVKKEGQTEEKKAPAGEKSEKPAQYRVKGDTENADGDAKPRPQTAEGAEAKPKRKRAPKKKDGEATGEEGKADGEKPAKPRAQTAKPKYRKKGEAGEEEGDTPKDGEETTPGGEESKGKDAKDKGPPKNLIYKNPMDFVEKRKFKTKWEEYRHGDWRKGSGKTFVTLETVIPAVPEKLLQLPNEAAFHTKQLDVENEIKKIGATLEEKKQNFDEILGQKKASLGAGDAGVVPTRNLTDKFQRMKVLKEERQKIFTAQDECTKGQAELISQREVHMKLIDRQFNSAELVPKGIKEQEKKLHTSTGGKAIEQKVIKQIEFLKASLEPIKKKEKLDAIIDKQYAAKKEASVGLAPIKNEMRALQKEIDVVKAQQTAKTESKETFDKQLDDINDKRKLLRDKRDKLFKEKEELRDNYYGSLVQYQKQQYLIQDIKWMTTMKTQITERESEKERRNKEYNERKERIAKEREEKKQREEDRKKRIEEKKERDAENKRLAELNARKNEITHLEKIQNDIASNSTKSNPMFEQIQQCDALLNFCRKSMNQKQEDAVEESKEADGPKEPKTNKELEAALKKGSLKQAQTKAEKDMMGSLQVGIAKKFKGKKPSAATAGGSDKSIDFKLLKQFNNLKISAPLNDEDFEKTQEDLKELKEALIYWGKIIQRQNKIKYIRAAKKIASEEEFTQQAEDEEKFIENEKQKFEGEDVSSKTSLKLDKLKIAQVIDRENKTKASEWDHPDEEDDDSGEEGVFRADDIVEDEEGEMHIQKTSGRGGRGGRGRGGRRGGAGVAGEEGEEERPKRGGPKKATRGNAKFSEILKQQEAFPTLDNDDNDEEEEEVETTPQ